MNINNKEQLYLQKLNYYNSLIEQNGGFFDFFKYLKKSKKDSTKTTGTNIQSTKTTSTNIQSTNTTGTNIQSTKTTSTNIQDLKPVSNPTQEIKVRLLIDPVSQPINYRIDTNLFLAKDKTILENNLMNIYNDIREK